MSISKKKNFSKKAFIAGALLLSTLATSLSAQMAGVNVVIIHGFVHKHLATTPTASIAKKDADSYWNESNQFWGEHADAQISWGTQDRIMEDDGRLGKILLDVLDQAKKISDEGLCDVGCILVTYSTGDLVTRKFLEIQNNFLDKPLNIIATVDIAGAGGGTELADSVVSAVNSNNPNLLDFGAIEVAQYLVNEELIKAGLEGNFIINKNNVGVYQDLVVNTARHLGMDINVMIPRLRLSADNGDNIQDNFISGTDDGVLPAHSTCGSAVAEYIESCSASLAYDGEIDNVKGPSGFMNNHFPIIMASNTSHGNAIRDVYSDVDMTYVNSYAWFDDKISTEIDEGFWWWSSDYQYIKNSANRSMSRVLWESVEP